MKKVKEALLEEINSIRAGDLKIDNINAVSGDFICISPQDLLSHLLHPQERFHAS
jgi:hypothetical protein